jgi:hypothetical protein
MMSKIPQRESTPTNHLPLQVPKEEMGGEKENVRRT